MSDILMPLERIAIASHPNLSEANHEAEEIAGFLQTLGVKSVLTTTLYEPGLQQKLENHEFDALIALGGDGTMLRAGHLCAPYDVPILGINLGRFGFLTELRRDQWREVLPRLTEGKYRLEKRMTLKAEHCHGEESNCSWMVINEVAVCRGRIIRPIRLQAFVDGYLLNSYVADGLIVATATGSTAYGLAAGGPIMPPELHNMLIIPVAPHLSMSRAIILGEGVRVDIIAHTDHEAVLSLDGQAPVNIADGDSVRVGAGEHTVSFIRLRDPGYFYRNLARYMEQNPSAGDIK
jgi:NAD+ kinase